MRSSRTSNVKAKELAKKYTAKRKAQTDSRIVKVDPQQRPQQQGLAAPGPAAYNQPNEQGRKVSRDLAGDEIKRDAEGNYDLDQVKDKNVGEQFLRGVVASTEQFIQTPKDIIEGVESQDQVVKETGIDLVINPLIQPLAQAQNAGFTNKQWYSPLGLFENKALPTFLQPDPNEKRDFFTGMGDNLGIIGDVVTHEDAGNMVGRGFEKSGERFMEAPAYYIGSAVGEIPYWVIGAGEIKAIASVAVKSAAYSARTGGKVANPVLMAKAYKNEQVVKKLEKATNLENKFSKKGGSIRSTREISKAVVMVKSAIGVSVRNYKQKVKQKESTITGLKKFGLTDEIKIVEDSIKTDKANIAKLEARSGELKQYKTEVKEINSIDSNKMITMDGKDISLKSVRKAEFNAKIQDELLPEVRSYRDQYATEVKGIAITEKAGKLADSIEKIPDVGKRINNYFKPKVRVAGEEDIPVLTAMEKRMRTNQEEGKYEGPLGDLRFQKDTVGLGVESFVNSKYTFYGRKKQKLKEVGETVSGMLSSWRVIDASELTRIKKDTQKRIDDLEAENIELERTIDVRLDNPQRDVITKTGKPRVVSESTDIVKPEKFRELEPMQKEFAQVSSSNWQRHTEHIAQNEAEIKALKKIQGNEYKELSFVTGVVGKGKKKKQIVMNYDALFAVSPKLEETLAPKKVFAAYRPSVSVTEVDGVITGTAGKFSFWKRDMAVKDAEGAFGSGNVSSKRQYRWARVGPKKYKKKVLIPKSEQVVDVLELYKATDGLMDAGKKHSNVSTTLAIPAGATPKEVALIEHMLMGGDFVGTDIISKSLPDGTTLVQTKQMTGYTGGKNLPWESSGDKWFSDVKVKSKKFDVIDEKDRKGSWTDDGEPISGDRKLTAEEIIENRDILKGKYDENWFRDQVNSINAIKDEGTVNVSGTQTTVKQQRMVELETKWESIQQRRKLFKEIGVHEVADSRGTFFSMPYKKARGWIEEDRMTMESTIFKDKTTGKKYYVHKLPPHIVAKENVLKEKRGKVGNIEVWEILDDSFHPSDVSSIPRLQTDRIKSGSAKPSQTGWEKSASIGPTDLLGEAMTYSGGSWRSSSSVGLPRLDRINLNRKLGDDPKPSKGEPKYGEEIFQDEASFEGKLRRLDPDEVSKLTKGDKIGSRLYEIEQAKYAVDQTKTTVFKTKEGAEIADRSVKDIVVAGTKIKLLKKGETILDSFAARINGDNFEWLRVRGDGLPEGQPNFMEKTGEIFDDGTRYTGLGVDNLTPSGFKRSDMSKVRTILAVGDQPGIKQGEIVAGFIARPLYTMDSVFYNSPNRQISKLQTMRDNLDANEFNRLKANKLQPYDAMEAYAKGQGSDQLNLFKNKILDLHAKKVNKVDEYNKGQKEAWIKDGTYDSIIVPAIKRIIKKDGKRNKFRKDVILPKRDLPGWSDATGKSGLKEIFKKKRRIPGIENKVGINPQQVMGTVPVTMRLPDPIFSTVDTVKDYVSRKVNVEVEDVDPRIRDAFVDAYEDVNELMELKRVDRRIYKKLKGRNESADQRGTRITGKNIDVEFKLDPSNIWFGKTKADYDLVERSGFKYTPKKKRFDDDETVTTERSEQYKKYLGERRTEEDTDPEWFEGTVDRTDKTSTSEIVGNKELLSRLSDDEIKSKVKDAIFARYGLERGLKSDSQIKKEAGQLATFEKLEKDMADGKPGAGKKLTEFLEEIDSSSSNMNSPAATFAQQVDKWSTVPKKTAERVKPEGRKTFGSERVAKAIGQEDPGFSGGMGLGGLLDSQSSIPQAYAQEENRLESISNTVTSSFDGITRGGIDIAVNNQQQVKMSNSPSGGILGVNQNLIPSQKIDTTIAGSTLGQLKTDNPASQISGLLGQLKTDNPASQFTGLMTTPFTSQIQNTGQVQGYTQLLGQLQRQMQSPVAPSSAFQRTLPASTPLNTPLATTPRVLPPPLPVIPLTAFGKPVQRRQQKRYKKKTGKAYWQTPQNWYEPYYWGGKDQMGSGYTVFKGREPAKVRKYDQKWFGLDLGNLW